MPVPCRSIVCLRGVGVRSRSIAQRERTAGMEHLGGRVAVITGGGSGIGRATVLAFAREQVAPIIADIDAERARDVEREARELGVDAVGVACDVTSDDGVLALRDLALERFGRVDIVMNNVSVIPI